MYGDAYVDQCGSPNIVCNAFECELERVAEKPGIAVRPGFPTAAYCNSREVTGSLFVFRLFFSEKSCEGNDVGIDRLLILLTASIGSHIVHFS